MPQHQNQRDVSLTEVGRQVGHTGVHILHVRYASDELAPTLTATMGYELVTDVAQGDETTQHEIVLKSGLTTVARFFWRRRITRDPGASNDGPDRKLLPVEVFDPASSFTPNPNNTTAVDSWSAELDSSFPPNGLPTWAFTLDVRSAQPAAPTWTATATKVLQIRNAVRYQLEVKKAGVLKYSGRLMVAVVTSGDEATPILLMGAARPRGGRKPKPGDKRPAKPKARPASPAGKVKARRGRARS